MNGVPATTPIIEARGLTKHFVKSLDLAGRVAARLGSGQRAEVVHAVEDVSLGIAKGEVIGLATFGNRDKVQGFNFLVASSTVKKFVKEARASNKPSETQTLWRKSLEAQWAGDLDTAIIGYEEVIEKFPSHSEAPRMLKQAHAWKKEGRGKKPEAPKQDEGGGSAAAVAARSVERARISRSNGSTRGSSGKPP